MDPRGMQKRQKRDGEDVTQFSRRLVNDSPHQACHASVSRELYFVREISARSQIGYPAYCHKAE